MVMAAEIRMRAERRLGQLMKEMPKNEGGYGPGRGKKSQVSEKPSFLPPTLAEQGIDHNLAHRARNAAAVAQILKGPLPAEDKSRAAVGP